MSPYSSVNDDVILIHVQYTVTDLVYSEETMPVLRTLPAVFAMLCRSYRCQI